MHDDGGVNEFGQTLEYMDSSCAFFYAIFQRLTTSTSIQFNLDSHVFGKGLVISTITKANGFFKVKFIWPSVCLFVWLWVFLSICSVGLSRNDKVVFTES